MPSLQKVNSPPKVTVTTTAAASSVHPQQQQQQAISQVPAETNATGAKNHLYDCVELVQNPVKIPETNAPLRTPVLLLGYNNSISMSSSLQQTIGLNNDVWHEDGIFSKNNETDGPKNDDSKDNNNSDVVDKKMNSSPKEPLTDSLVDSALNRQEEVNNPAESNEAEVIVIDDATSDEEEQEKNDVNAIEMIVEEGGKEGDGQENENSSLTARQEGTSAPQATHFSNSAKQVTIESHNEETSENANPPSKQNASTAPPIIHVATASKQTPVKESIRYVKDTNVPNASSNPTRVDGPTVCLADTFERSNGINLGGIPSNSSASKNGELSKQGTTSTQQNQEIESMRLKAQQAIRTQQPQPGFNNMYQRQQQHLNQIVGPHDYYRQMYKFYLDQAYVAGQNCPPQQYQHTMQQLQQQMMTPQSVVNLNKPNQMMTAASSHEYVAALSQVGKANRTAANKNSTVSKSRAPQPASQIQVPPNVEATSAPSQAKQSNSNQVASRNATNDNNATNGSLTTAASTASSQVRKANQNLTNNVASESRASQPASQVPAPSNAEDPSAPSQATQSRNTNQNVTNKNDMGSDSSQPASSVSAPPNVKAPSAPSQATQSSNLQRLHSNQVARQNASAETSATNGSRAAQPVSRNLPNPTNASGITNTQIVNYNASGIANTQRVNNNASGIANTQRVNNNTQHGFGRWLDNQIEASDSIMELEAIRHRLLQLLEKTNSKLRDKRVEIALHVTDYKAMSTKQLMDMLSEQMGIETDEDAAAGEKRGRSEIEKLSVSKKRYKTAENSADRNQASPTPLVGHGQPNQNRSSRRKQAAKKVDSLAKLTPSIPTQISVEKFFTEHRFYVSGSANEKFGCMIVGPSAQEKLWFKEIQKDSLAAKYGIQEDDQLFVPDMSCQQMKEHFIEASKAPRPMIFHVRRTCTSANADEEVTHRFVVAEPGKIGLKIKRTVTPDNSAASIVSFVDDKSLAEKLGIQVGDILCKPNNTGSEATDVYKWFLERARSDVRPFIFEVKRKKSATPSSFYYFGSPNPFLYRIKD